MKGGDSDGDRVLLLGISPPKYNQWPLMIRKHAKCDFQVYISQPEPFVDQFDQFLYQVNCL